MMKTETVKFCLAAHRFSEVGQFGTVILRRDNPICFLAFRRA